MHKKLYTFNALLSIPLLEMMVACGADLEALKQKELEENSDADKKATDTKLTPEHTVKAIMKLEDGLSDVSGSYALVNCTGQVDRTFTHNKISLADEAIGCRVAINHLQIGDRGFHISDKNPEWKTGDVLHFNADDGSPESLDVLVDHQLSSTPSLTENVYFTVSRSDAAPSEGSKTLLATGMDGSLAPSFRIRKTEFIGMSATGAGQFVFHLDCLKAIKTLVGQAPVCDGMDLGSIRYLLVKDDFKSSLSFDEADQLFSSHESQRVDAKTDFEPFKAERKQLGGFVTPRDHKALEGPAQLHDNPNMLLILQGPGPSYQYFNVDVVFTSN